jgi:hypothetical protein
MAATVSLAPKIVPTPATAPVEDIPRHHEWKVMKPSDWSAGDVVPAARTVQSPEPGSEDDNDRQPSKGRQPRLGRRNGQADAHGDECAEDRQFNEDRLRTDRHTSAVMPRSGDQ